MLPPTRRCWLSALCLAWLSLLPIQPAAAGGSAPVATFDWATAETLLALEASPVAMGSLQAFHTWTGNRYAQADIIDVGVQSLPNVELLSHIEPRWILLPPRQAHLGVKMEGIAPTTVLRPYPYAGEQDLLATLDAFTLETGKLVGREREARRLIAETDAHFTALKETLDPQPPLLVVQLQDERHARVYGEHSLFAAVLERLGLQSAWQGATNAWGYSLVGVDELFAIDNVRLVVIQGAYPSGFETRLARSGMWQYLPSVRRGDELVLPAGFWIAGTLPSARRFADALVQALENPDA